MKRTHLLIGLAGLAMVVGFFMPWLDIAGLGGASGWDIVTSDMIEWTTRLALGLCPVAGVVLFLAAFGKSRSAATVAMASGAGVLGYTFCKLAYAFIKVTGAGLWLVLAAGVVALVAGLRARSQTR